MTEFCRFLTHGYSFTKDKNNLIVKPCCWYRDGVKFENHQTTRSSWSQVSNWTSGCVTCQQLEKSGSKSFRHASFDIVPDNMPQSPVAVDINLDYNCNAACVMCGPNLSSAWAQQIKKQKVIEIEDKSNLYYINKVTTSLDLSNVRRIKFFGGEPLLTDTHINILKKLPNPSDVEIWYTTNGSILPDKELIELWSKFKLIFFEVSIDGIGSKFEYLRWPLNWEKINKNLMELKESAPPNLLFRINYTLNPFNVFYYDEVENWVRKNFNQNKLGDLNEINCHPCRGIWDLQRTPKLLREKIYEKYGNHPITNMLKLLPEDDYLPIINFTKQWDPIRKNNWKSVFLEIVEYFP